MEYTIKEYDTVDILCVYKDDSGQPYDITDITVESQLRSAYGQLICDMKAKVVDAIGGQFTIEPTIAKLPSGNHKIDVYFSQGGSRVASETFNLPVQQAVTHPSGV